MNFIIKIFVATKYLKDELIKILIENNEYDKALKAILLTYCSSKRLSATDIAGSRVLFSMFFLTRCIYNNYKTI